MTRWRVDLAGLAAGGAVQLTASAGVAVLSTLWLSPHDRGVMVIAATIPAIVSVLATLGIGNAFRARWPRAGSRTLALGQAYSALVLATAALGATAAAALVAAAAWLTTPELASAPLLLAVALAGATLCLSTTLTDAWFAAGRFAAGARWSAASAILGLVSSVIAHPTSAPSFLATQFLSMLCVLLVSVVPLGRAGILRQPHLDRQFVPSLVREGIPSLGFLVGTTVLMRADRVILAAFVSPAVVAAYALASTVSEVLRIGPTALGQIALHRGASDPLAHAGDLQRRNWILIALGALVVMPLAVFLIPSVFGSAYAASPGLLGAMLAGEFFFGTFLVTSMFHVGSGRAARAAVVALVGALACGPCYVLGSMAGGAFGCAVAGSVIYGVVALVSGRALSPRREDVR